MREDYDRGSGGGGGGFRSRGGTRVYVGGINNDVKKEDLEVEFEKYGKLNNVWVAYNPPGFAFVEFDDRRDAENACDTMNNAELLGSRVRVEISRGRGRGGGGSGGGGGGGRRGGGGSRGGGGNGGFRDDRGPPGGGKRGSGYGSRGGPGQRGSDGGRGFRDRSGGGGGGFGNSSSRRGGGDFRSTPRNSDGPPLSSNGFSSREPRFRSRSPLGGGVGARFSRSGEVRRDFGDGRQGRGGGPSSYQRNSFSGGY